MAQVMLISRVGTTRLAAGRARNKGGARTVTPFHVTSLPRPDHSKRSCPPRSLVKQARCKALSLQTGTSA